MFDNQSDNISALDDSQCVVVARVQISGVGSEGQLTIDIACLGCVCQEHKWRRELCRLACPVCGRLASSKCLDLGVTSAMLSTTKAADCLQE